MPPLLPGSMLAHCSEKTSGKDLQQTYAFKSAYSSAALSVTMSVHAAHTFVMDQSTTASRAACIEAVKSQHVQTLFAQCKSLRNFVRCIHIKLG